MESKTTTTSFAGNIDLSVFRKKRFTIDNQEDRVLELDTSDLMITSRLNESYPKLEQLSAEVTKLSDGIHADEEHAMEDLATISENLKAIDTKMRELIDYIFDTNASEMCVPSGSMYDPIGGQLRYERIITVLAGLYEEQLSKEIKKVQNRMKSHTDKYTGKK